ncbi:DM DNA-binding domain-containing protein [Trichostrongylus colubriformis]|uniref:DM DNA-binding domain-containing protein n=1 Tax=Trichostrongylus colubriformis TaxID=6319 RepID=A0AAN8G3I4_TRICO
MALCDITATPQLIGTVDTSHFRQFFPQKSGTTRKTPQLGQFDFMAENDNKKIYFCQRCLNHGSRLPRKNHKCECPYADCKCKLCFLVEKRRQLNSQLHDLEVIELESSKRADDDDSQPPSSNSDIDRMVRVKGGEYRIPADVNSVARNWHFL